MKFVVYCIEIYRSAKGLRGKEVYDIFATTGLIDFIDEFYDVLHSTGKQDIIWQIDDYLRHRTPQKNHV
ncbi:MAG: DUF3791 domain-containing protein [Oscillospiraceae bacterium]|jgi:hypothetical protein|nr:DUF3791 domain-containing protein [Oscillospiraceae bacterium]